MKFYPLIAICLSALFSGCVSNPPNAEFVHSVDFSSLDTFNYKHTLASGMDWRDSDEYIIEELSAQVLSAELVSRGFTQMDRAGDFYVVAKWRKAVSSHPSIFNHIDGPRESLNDRSEIAYQTAVRYTLIVEIYQYGTNNLFWRKELPDIFDAIQFTEDRIAASLVRAIKNFPTHIEKDPNLPSLE